MYTLKGFVGHNTVQDTCKYTGIKNENFYNDNFIFFKT